jgi:hypothetical protein
MDILKKYIEENRQAFDCVEPTNGHFERMFEKAANQKNKSKFNYSKAFWSYSIAASLLLALTLGIVFTHLSKKTENSELLCTNAKNMKRCYIRQMENVASNIENLSKKYDEFTKDDINTEVKNIIEMSHYFEYELPQELSNAKKAAIMSDFYQHNLNTLQDIAMRITY